MVVSFLVSAILLIGDKMTWWCGTAIKAQALLDSSGLDVLVLNTHHRLLITVAITTVAWVMTAYLGPRTDMNTLIGFYKKVRPGGPGWEPVRKAAGLSVEEVRNSEDNFPMALLGWTCGCAMIWSSLFLVGNILYGRTAFAILCAVVFVVSSAVVIRIVNKLWK